MFCWKCGSEIREGAKFCTKCGSSLDRSVNRSAEPVRQSIDYMSDSLGDAIDRAASEIKHDFSRTYEDKRHMANGARNDSNRFSTGRNDQTAILGSETDGNEGYFTIGNMEMLVTLSLFVSLVSWILCSVVIPVLKTLLGFVDVIGTILSVLSVVLKVGFIVIDIAAIVAVVYLLVSYVYKRTPYSYITAIAVGLNLIAAIMMLIGNRTGYEYETISTVLRTAAIIIDAVIIVWGVDLISRVILQGEGIESEPNIGRDMSEYGALIKRIRESSQSEQREAELAIIHNPDEASYFDGRGIELIGNMLVFILVSAITCGIGTPWMLCRIYRWRKSHTVINGRRLAFTGTGGGLLGRWILWTILTIVTCGLFSLVEHVFLIRWEMDNTRYADETGTNGRFEGEWASYIGYGIVQDIILTITCGLGWPWTTTMITKWEMKHSIVGRDHMKYDGTALGLLGTYLLVWFLDIITLGIYSAWGVCRLNRYIYSHTHVDHSEC